MTAAMAPSVARIGATTPTLPTRRANPATRMPMTLPSPRTTIHGMLGPMLAGTPEATTNGVVMMSPTSITHATDDADPMIFTARDDIRLLLAKKHAVRSPKTMLTTS